MQGEYVQRVVWSCCLSVMVVDAQAASEVPPQDFADPSSPFQEQDDAMGARSLPWLTMGWRRALRGTMSFTAIFLYHVLGKCDANSSSESGRCKSGRVPRNQRNCPVFVLLAWFAHIALFCWHVLQHPLSVFCCPDLISYISYLHIPERPCFHMDCSCFPHLNLQMPADIHCTRVYDLFVPSSLIYCLHPNLTLKDSC